MRSYNCPSCGAEITFYSPVSVSCVCDYCRSLVVRHDAKVEQMGQMAVVPDDVSPFQIGVTGRFDDAPFCIIGRIRMAWEDGGWNEWFLLLDDGRKAWLAEAQGSLAISFEQRLPKHLTRAPLQLGQNITVDSESYTIADLKEAHCVACEGELPNVLKPEQKVFVADGMNGGGKFLSLACDEDWRPAELFVGVYAEFDSLGFSHLRDVPGWSDSPPRPAPAGA
jgi:hypothetical protein